MTSAQGSTHSDAACQQPGSASPCSYGDRQKSGRASPMARRGSILLACLLVACSEDRGDGRGFLGGQAGVVPPCATGTIECPDSGPAPTYSGDVAPILSAHCTGCHGPGGENQDVPLTTYQDLATRPTAISFVLACKMPPPPLAALSAPERETLVCWYSRGKAK